MPVSTAQRPLEALGKALPTQSSVDVEGRAAAHLQVGSAPFQRELTVPFKGGQPMQTAFPGVLEWKTEEAKTEGGVEAFLQSASQLASQPDPKTQSKSAGPDADKSTLRQLLTASGGALQFRNTPLRTAQDFSEFMHTLAEGAGWTPHVDKGLMVLRRPHAKNVATANEGPPDKAIGSHNEYGLSSHYPSYIAFFCLSAPERGGETPLASSLRLHDRLAAEAPSYLEAVQKQGISFAIHHPRSNVEGHIGGNSVLAPNSFGAESSQLEKLDEAQKREIVEANVRALAAEGGWVSPEKRRETATEKKDEEEEDFPAWKSRGYSGHWMPDGSFVVVQRTPGVRPHPVFGAPSYFTNVHTRFIYAGVDQQTQLDEEWTKPLSQWVAEQQKEQTLVPPVQLPPYITSKAGEPDDDHPFPQEWIDAILRITAEEQVDVSWQVGDVVLIDNLAVQHGRRPWQGDRRLLASLWDAAPIQEGSRV